jgi:hypothetical protein
MPQNKGTTTIRFYKDTFTTYSDKFGDKCKLKMIKSLMDDLNIMECKVENGELKVKEY